MQNHAETVLSSVKHQYCTGSELGERTVTLKMLLNPDIRQPCELSPHHIALPIPRAPIINENIYLFQAWAVLDQRLDPLGLLPTDLLLPRQSNGEGDSLQVGSDHHAFKVAVDFDLRAALQERCQPNSVQEQVVLPNKKRQRLSAYSTTGTEEPKTRNLAVQEASCRRRVGLVPISPQPSGTARKHEEDLIDIIHDLGWEAEKVEWLGFDGCAAVDFEEPPQFREEPAVRWFVRHEAERSSVILDVAKVDGPQARFPVVGDADLLCDISFAVVPR